MILGKRPEAIGVLCIALCCQALAQSPADLTVLQGLAPLTLLSKTAEGTAALSANYSVTGGIQTGAIRQSTLLPFLEQQQQALRDVFITYGNLSQLADGLGTTLGGAYVARAHYIDSSQYTSVSPAVAEVIAYAEGVSGTHSNQGKYFFANATTDGKTPAAADALAILSSMGGETDVYGKSYGLPAGAPGADAYGDSRPFQTEATVAAIAGPDYLNHPADNRVYNRGPLMNLQNSPSYPSGHTTYGYTGALLLAVLVPSRYQQMVTRGAEYGNDRILVGAHYAMDVIGGRTLALYDMAHLLANDHAYLGRTLPRAPALADFQAAINKARAELAKALQSACGKAIEDCAREDTGRLNNPAGNEAFYADTQTYDLPVVYPQTAARLEDVGKLAPEAAFLLTIAFPSLTQDQANTILTETEGPGGGFLDDGSSFGVYSRLNLDAAAGRAAAFVAGGQPKTRR
jgi:hypothetical protein